MQIINTQKNNQDQMNFLNQSLQQFGLCPKDWNLKKESNQKYIITHKDDPDFFFIGKIKTETKSWDFIQLGLI